MGFTLDWQTVGGIILMLLVVVAIHELGHFIVAKRAGIMVLEFSIGFGPRLASRVRGETRYSLRLLPLGGYVRMAGMTGEEATPLDGGDRAFVKASTGRRAATLAAGGLMNLVLAGALFSGLAAVGGPAPQVQSGGGLARAGASSGYQVVGIGGTRTTSLTKIRNLVQSDAGRPLAVSLERWGGGPTRTVTVRPQLHWVSAKATKVPFEAQVVAIAGRPPAHATPSLLLQGIPGRSVAVTYLTSAGSRRTVSVPRSDFAADWLIGYLASEGNLLVPGIGGPPMPWYQAVAVGFGTVPYEIGATFSNLWTLLTAAHRNPNLRLSGPVGIAQETSIAAQISASLYLTLMGLISLNLGLFNLLPIPFLDGGRLFFVLLEWVRRRRINPQVEAYVHALGLALIVMLFIYVTYGDVTHLHQ